MRQRISRARELLYRKLKEVEAPGDWSHILNQKGMYSISGLTKEQVDSLKEKYHIYMLKSGRINVCNVNQGNVQRIAEAFKDVLTSTNSLK